MISRLRPLPKLVLTPCRRTYFEVKGELRYREYTPAESDRSVRVAEIHTSSILALDRPVDSRLPPLFYPKQATTSWIHPECRTSELPIDVQLFTC